MEENPKPRHRWFRFNLRTLFVLVTLVCIYLGWAMNWIRQRHQFLERTDINIFALFGYRDTVSSEPVLLWPLGEKGQEALVIWSCSEADVLEAQWLFPEAEINPSFTQ